jgi:lipopolysaccharide export system permease protein
MLKQMVPLSFFFSTLVFLSLLSKNFELVALRTLGIRLYKVIVPILLLAAVTGVFMTYWNFEVVPWGIARSSEVQKIDIQKKKWARHMRYTDIWLKKGDVSCLIRFFDERQRLFKRVKCIAFQNGRIETLTASEKALWTAGGWEMVNPKVIKIEGTMIREEYPPYLTMPLNISPNSLLERKKEPWEMNFQELRDYKRAMEEEGYRIPHLRMEFYERVVLAFSPLVLALMVFPLAVRPPREGGWQGIIYSIIALVLYYAVYISFTMAGKKGWLPPLIAAFLPPVGLSSLVLWSVKKREV